MAQDDHTAEILSLTGGKIDVAPRMRNAFLVGLKQYCDNEKKTLNEVVAGWWKDDWKAAAQLLTRFLPREVNVHGTHEHVHQFESRAVSRVVDWIEEVTGDGENTNASDVGKARPVLPAPVSDEQAGSESSVATGEMPGSTK